MLSGEVQLSSLGQVSLPVTSQPGVTQMDLSAQLTWEPEPLFRLDAELDYSLLYSDPLQQRVGVPVTAALQAGSHAFSLTSGLYVFNDFDDVDVPALLAWTAAWSGWQGPLMQIQVRGGFVDVTDPTNNWTVHTQLTFFAYL